MLHSTRTRAFTLIELLVVIAIIGILSAVVLTSLNTARGKGYDAVRASNLTEIQKALILYYDNNGHYPIQSTNWSSECAGWIQTTQDQVMPGLVPTYISVLPEDPSINTTAASDCLMYKSDATGKDYKLLDYNMTKAVDPDNAGLVDPARNVGKAWAVPGCTGASNTSVGWAIWSSPTSMCW